MIGLIASLFIRLLVGGLLTLAGSGKIIAGARQREKWLQAYGLIPAPLVPAVAIVIPSGEVLAGAALLVGFGGRASTAMSSAMLVLITAGAGVTLARGNRPDCGCFGNWARDQLSWRIVGRNVGLIGLVGVIGAFNATQPGISGFPLSAQAALLASLSALVVLVPAIAARGLLTRRTMASLSPVAR